MIDRRAFLEAGVALPAAALAASAELWAASETALALERVIFDPRFDEAVEIAAHAGELGLKISPVADDLMALWYDELNLLWNDEPRAIAGVTLSEALFVLETLAADYRMRLVYRGAHSPADNGRITHRLAGPAAIVEPLAALPADGDWQAELAEAINACPLGEPATAAAEFATHAPSLSLRDETVYSWIIAPRSAVALTLPG